MYINFQRDMLAVSISYDFTAPCYLPKKITSLPFSGANSSKASWFRSSSMEICIYIDVPGPLKVGDFNNVAHIGKRAEVDVIL